MKYGTKYKIKDGFFKDFKGIAIDSKIVSTQYTWNKDKRDFDKKNSFQYLIKINDINKERWFAEFELEVLK